MFTATVLTMFPEAFPGPLGVSLIGTAWREHGLWALETVDIRDFSKDKRGFLDDTPAGGGPGQVMRADVIASALDSIEAGGRPLLEVLDAQRNYRETYRLFITSRADYGRAVVRLDAALGKRYYP